MDQLQIIGILESNPQECAGILRERVELKQREILESRNNVAANSW
jgi:hypothetical protein